MSTDITNYIVSAMKSNRGCLWDASAAGLTLRGVRKVIFKEVTFSLKKELLESGPEGTQNKQRAPTEVLSVAGQSRKETDRKVLEERGRSSERPLYKPRDQGEDWQRIELKRLKRSDDAKSSSKAFLSRDTFLPVLELITPDEEEIWGYRKNPRDMMVTWTKVLAVNLEGSRIR